MFDALTSWVMIRSKLRQIMENTSGSGGGSTLPVALTFANPLVADMTDGSSRKIAVTGDFTIMPPINPTEGDELLMRLDVDGTNRKLSLSPTILIPSDSGFISPKTLTAGHYSFIKFIYQGSSWSLVSLVGEYVIPT